ncbi:MAG: hypothetical protein CVU70_00250 [Deltaproteobacteria bacterium HGW-Deltaproteobacteria-5]|jgi:hypothetical protein|nr:MAG: hypothetical protein CVU70_00250 [Deltaproteobacteria bacterium HGW-Deltaproteobacteria-5]
MIHLSEESQKQNRLEMIKQALKDKAPLTYSELETSGKLQEFLEAHDNEMMARYNDAKKKAWEETLDSSLGFADSCCDETSSPM